MYATTTANRARILVIDDDPLFRSLIVSLLRKGSLVSVAGEGSEGFYKALEYPPDLVVIDIQMPGWDGLKTLKAFRSHPTLTHVKTLVLTSDASRETVLAAIHAGANDYLIKTSFSKEEFLQKLNRLFPEAIVSRKELSEQESPDSPTVPESHAPAGPVTARNPEITLETVDDDTTLAVGEDESQLRELIDAWE